MFVFLLLNVAMNMVPLAKAVTKTTASHKERRRGEGVLETHATQHIPASLHALPCCVCSACPWNAITYYHTDFSRWGILAIDLINKQPARSIKMLFCISITVH